METNPELLAYLEEMARATGAAGNAADRMAETIRDGLPNWDAASNGVRGLGRSSEEASKKVKSSFDRFTTGLKSASDNLKSGFKSLGSESQSGAQAIKNVTDTIGGAISGFTSQFGIIGSAIGGTVTAITGMAGVALGFVDELTQTNKKLNETGIMFGKVVGPGSGIDEFDQIVKNAGLSAGMLNTVIDNSSESLRLFSGGAANGIRIVTDGFKKLRNANNGQLESLYKLGYSTEEIMSGMADFGATAKLAGQDLNMDQLAEGTTKYLTMQRELTRLTGTEIKDAKARAEKLTREAAFQSYLQGLEPAAASAVKEMLAALPESQQEIAKAAMMGYEIMDPALAFVKNQVPGFVDEFKNIGQMAESGRLNMENVAALTARTQELANEEFTRVRDSLGDARMLGQFSQAGGRIGEIVTILGDTIADARKNAAAAKDNVNTTQAVAQGMGDIAKALPEIETASIALRSALYTVGSNLTAVFAPLITSLAGTVKGGAEAIHKTLNAITSGQSKAAEIMAKGVGDESKFAYATEEARQEAVNKAIADSIGTIGDGTMFEGLFDQLGSTVSTAISQGFTQAIREINPFVMTERKALEFEKTPEFEEIKKIIQSMEPGENIMSQYGNPGEAARVLQYLEAFDPETRIKKMQELGLAEEKLFVDKFNDWVFGLFGSESDSKSLVKVPAQAYGNIMEPKLGGHIVRVAEAGQPEIIAPASRGPGGKLGLEVSGAMLDNSRLLQSLLKVNEGQAALMAGLNDKINNMSGHMENLVSAQRQANRLAV